MRTVVLVACGQTKLDRAAPAADLYTGQLFQKARAFAELVGDAWYVLSAKHHVLRPGQTVEPYDARVPQAKADRHRWGIVTRNDLNRHLLDDLRIELERQGERGPLAFPEGAVRIVILAGRDYVDPLVPLLPDAFEVIDPLQGLQIGERLSWLKAVNDAADAKYREARAAGFSISDSRDYARAEAARVERELNATTSTEGA